VFDYTDVFGREDVRVKATFVRINDQKRLPHFTLLVDILRNAVDYELNARQSLYRTPGRTSLFG
jgi:hypothetical protein